jgi:hypothetical protein
MTMILTSSLWLRRYSRLQIVGAIVITTGIVVSLFPSLEEYGGTPARLIFLWLTLLLVCQPNSIGSDDSVDEETGWNRCVNLLEYP